MGSDVFGEVAAVVLFTSVLLHSGGAVYPNPITHLCENGSSCLVLYQDNQDKTWQEAYDLCTDKGLSLLSIHDQAVQDRVERLLQQSDGIRNVDSVWTAGRQREDGEFRFRNGDVFNDISRDDIRSEENCVMGQLDYEDQGSVKFITDNCAELYAATFVVCQNETQDCADGYASGDYCYRQHGSGNDRFYNKMTCLAHNSDLIQSSIMGDSGLLSYLHTLTHGRYNFWIGAARYRWTWEFPDGPEMLYYNWFPAEPQDLMSGCMYVDHESGDHWRHTPCSTQLSYFICVNVTSDRSSSTTTTTTTTTSTPTTTTTSTTTTPRSTATTTTTRPSNNTPIPTAPSSSEPVSNNTSSTTESSLSDGGDFNILYVIIPVVGVVVIVAIIVTVVIVRKRKQKTKTETDDDQTNTYNNTIIPQSNGISDNLYADIPQAGYSTVITDPSQSGYSTVITHPSESEYSTVITDLSTDTSAPTDYVSATDENKKSSKKKKDKKKKKAKKSKSEDSDSGTLSHKVAPGGDVYALPMKGPGHNGDKDEVPHVMTETGDIYALPKKDHADGVCSAEIGDIAF